MTKKQISARHLASERVLPIGTVQFTDEKGAIKSISLRRTTFVSCQSWAKAVSAIEAAKNELFETPEYSFKSFAKNAGGNIDTIFGEVKMFADVVGDTVYVTVAEVDTANVEILFNIQEEMYSY